MEIIEKIEAIVKKAESDPDILKKLKEDPAKAIEELSGIDIPEDKINEVIAGVKAKLAIDSAGDKVEGLGEKLEDAAKGAIDGIKKLL
ncbi:MAG: hypothetical protein PHC41_06395 [Lachnospiraceae bacterium]|nr:hypothetical protein [Lachnospiraceae bacterium]MDD3615841.1 hypothetical protein [Lachnospiraceae bacterium]